MRIGILAAQSGVGVQALRYYERRGLLTAPKRSRAGFREYEADTARRVRFIRRAQGLGFTLEEVRELLALWTDSSKSCAAVEKRARATLARIEAKMVDLKRMNDALAQYVTACRARPAMQECPLLAGLGGTEETKSG